jgi:hypothetical protein
MPRVCLALSNGGDGVRILPQSDQTRTFCEATAASIASGSVDPIIPGFTMPFILTPKRLTHRVEVIHAGGWHHFHDALQALVRAYVLIGLFPSILVEASLRNSLQRFYDRFALVSVNFSRGAFRGAFRGPFRGPLCGVFFNAGRGA